VAVVVKVLAVSVLVVELVVGVFEKEVVELASPEVFALAVVLESCSEAALELVVEERVHLLQAAVEPVPRRYSLVAVLVLLQERELLI
jgi:hypothetical protein